MTTRLPFNRRERAALTQNGLGHRPRSGWGGGDLPGPWAEGDIVRVPDGAKALGRMHGMGPGVYVVSYACSIDEGDAWYHRLAGRGDVYGSDRLHVIPAGVIPNTPAVDWMAHVELVDTADPDGLVLREQMLADGWAFVPPWGVHAERDLYRAALEAVRSGCGRECAVTALDIADQRNAR